MKKWLLGLGTMAAIVAPIVAVVSCSETTDKITTMENQVKNFVKTGWRVEKWKISLGYGYFMLHIRLTSKQDGDIKSKIISSHGDIMDLSDKRTLLNFTAWLEQQAAIYEGEQ